MKKLIFSIMLLSSFIVAAETRQEPISVRSIETQNTNKSAVIVKSADQQAAPNLKAIGGHKLKQAAIPQQRQQGFARANNTDFWIFDAFIDFNSDPDFDGYYSYFTLEFDVDTVYSNADVYARLFLSRGDVFEEFHTSSVFRINGDSSLDSLVIESELVSGFPPGDYELLIEIYDAFDDSLVAIYDGYDDVDLTLLTLESRSFEETQTVVVVRESGGSFGYLMLLVVPLLIRRRILRA
jgi:hypothetical protein